jgi:hypothetical protein
MMNLYVHRDPIMTNVHTYRPKRRNRRFAQWAFTLAVFGFFLWALACGPW